MIRFFSYGLGLLAAAICTFSLDGRADSAYTNQVSQNKQEALNSFLSVYARKQPVGCWSETGYALAAVALQRTDLYENSRGFLRTLFRDPDYYSNVLVENAAEAKRIPNPAVSQDPQQGDCYTAQQDILRIYLTDALNNWTLLNAPMDPADPSSLTIKNAMENAFLADVKLRSRLSDAESHLIEGSENHFFTRRTPLFIMLEIVRAKMKKDRTPLLFPDGKSINVHYSAWINYWRTFFQSMARNGGLTEYASPTYQKYSVTDLMLLADYAQESTVASGAQQFLLLTFADAAQEFLSADGVRGGSIARDYKDIATLDNSTGISVFGWTYGWTTHAVNLKSVVYVAAMASPYTPPQQLRDIAIHKFSDPSASSLLSVSSIRPAGIAKILGITATGAKVPYAALMDSSRLVRQSSVGRNFVLGTSFFPTKDAANQPLTFAGISSEAVKMGVAFSSSSQAQISVLGQGNHGTASPFGGSIVGFSEINGVSSDRAALIWHDNRAIASNGTLVYFSTAGNLDAQIGNPPRDGWIFSQSDTGEYVAVNISGGYSIIPVALKSISYGKALLLNDETQAVVIEVAEKEAFSNMNKFQQKIRSLPLTRKGPEVTYTSISGKTFFTDTSTQVPTIDGTKVLAHWNRPFSGQGSFITSNVSKIVVLYPGYKRLGLTFTFPASRCEISKPANVPNAQNDPFAGQTIAVAQSLLTKDSCLAGTSKYASAFGLRGLGLVTTRWIQDGRVVASQSN